ncbi:hypothetical protein LXL04_019307 [Taraxacum kok-saghyz]
MAPLNKPRFRRTLERGRYASVATLRVRISGKRPTRTELVRGLPGRSPDKRSDGQVRSMYDESNLELRVGSELNLSTVATPDPKNDNDPFEMTMYLNWQKSYPVWVAVVENAAEVEDENGAQKTRTPCRLVLAFSCVAHKKPKNGRSSPFLPSFLLSFLFLMMSGTSANNKSSSTSITFKILTAIRTVMGECHLIQLSRFDPYLEDYLEL